MSWTLVVTLEWI